MSGKCRNGKNVVDIAGVEKAVWNANSGLY